MEEHSITWLLGGALEPYIDILLCAVWAIGMSAVLVLIVAALCADVLRYERNRR